MTFDDFRSILPVLTLTAYACGLLLVDLVIPAGRKQWTGWLGLVGLGAAAAAMIPWPLGGALRGFGGLIAVDGFSVFLNVVFLLSAGLALLLAQSYLPRAGLQRGEFYVLLLFTVSGMMLIAQAADPIIVFLALRSENH